MKNKIAAGLQIAGASSFVVAGFLVHIVAGFSIAGVAALVFGIALERDAEHVNEPDAVQGRVDVAPAPGPEQARPRPATGKPEGGYS